MKSKKVKDFGFGRYFHPDKSPHTQWNEKKQSWDYLAKHLCHKGKISWESFTKGMYIRNRDGALC